MDLMFLYFTLSCMATVYFGLCGFAGLSLIFKKVMYPTHLVILDSCFMAMFFIFAYQTYPFRQ